MKKQTIALIAAILAIVAVATIVVVALGQSELGTGLQAFEILRRQLQSPSLSMELSVSARLSDSDLRFTAIIERSQWEGHSLTTVTKDGTTLCYTEGVVLAGNGQAYRLTEAYPDYSQLLEQALQLYRNVEVEAQDGVYTINAEDSSAEAILATLLPGTEISAGTLGVELVTEEDQLAQIRFRGTFTEDESECRITATVEILGTETTVAIPDAVQEAIRSGRLDAAQDLTDDLLRLVAAWTRLSGESAIGTAVTLTADCGVLKLQDDLTFYRSGHISAIEKYGRMIYFTDAAICDQNGNVISTSEADALQAGQLLDLTWQLCANSQLTCSRTGRIYTYTLTLDKEGMAAVSQAIVPQTADMDIGFQSGSIVLEIEDDRLQSIRLTVSGEMDALLVQIPASVSAAFFILEDVTFQIPQAVQNTLG